MSIILGIYLAGFFTAAGYGAGHCYGTGGGHMMGPGPCTVLTTAASVVWPVTVTAAIAEKVKK
nr:hypothetical protein BdHM001_18540 [Bdellovibrio sp. HM001]